MDTLTQSHLPCQQPADTKHGKYGERVGVVAKSLEEIQEIETRVNNLVAFYWMDLPAGDGVEELCWELIQLCYYNPGVAQVLLQSGCELLHPQMFGDEISPLIFEACQQKMNEPVSFHYTFSVLGYLLMKANDPKNERAELYQAAANLLLYFSNGEMNHYDNQRVAVENAIELLEKIQAAQRQQLQTVS